MQIRTFWVYLVMPFGLKNVLTIFQQLYYYKRLQRYKILYSNSYSIIIDDIIIFSPDLDSHYKHLAEVHDRLRKASLYTKLEKSKFCDPFLDCLSHTISADSILTDPKKKKKKKKKKK